jgi:UDPglucose 6-dehydrogenase
MHPTSKLNMTDRPLHVSLVGLGYVGLCTAVTFATRGFETLGVDIDSAKVSRIEAGRAPIHEPRLDKLLKAALRTKRLRVTEDVSSVAATDVIFITVGTPSEPDGSAKLRYVEEATRQIGTSLREERDHRLVVVKSTVTPGTTRSMVRPALEQASGKKVGVQLGLCFNPEFLREGSAIHDALHPDRLVIGAIDAGSANRLEGLYRAFYGRNLPPTLVTTPETAELIKYASNAFLAAKVSYINTIANIAQLVPGVDVEKVAEGVGLDPRIGPLFLKAGPGYGGSCFHKDLQALIAFGRQRGYDPKLLGAVEEVNEEQAGKVVELSEKLVGSLKDKRVAVLGLAFKKDTDDIREAASLRVIERLKKKGAEVTAHDPMAIPNARQVLGNSVEFAADPRAAISQADCCIIMTEWDEFRELRAEDYVGQMRSPNVVDARRLYRPQDLEGLSRLAIGLGEANSPGG